jgi:hypothetical protein
MNSHRTRSVLQLVGIVLGVASVVATFGLIDGGRQQVMAFLRPDGRRAQDADPRQGDSEVVQTAAQKSSQGLTYDDAVVLAREAKLLELVEPTVQRNELVKGPGYEKTLEDLGRHVRLRAHVRLPPRRGPFPDRRGRRGSAKVRGPRLAAAPGDLRRAPAVGQTLVHRAAAPTRWWASCRRRSSTSTRPDGNALEVDEQVRLRARHHHAQPDVGATARARRWPT